MATFTPPIQPINDPDYERSKSRPVDIGQTIKPEGVATNQIMPHGVMQGDTSAAYAGEAAAAGVKAQAVGDAAYGDLFKNLTGTLDFAGKAGVQMVRKDIENQVYEVADKERQSYTDLLENIKAQGGVRGVLDSNGGDTASNIPAEIGSLPDRLASLQSANASGKISGTYYQSQLLAKAKELRAQYPGFREEIDQAFAKVTGSNPANAYVRSLVGDINRAAATIGSETNKAESFVAQRNGYPGAATMMDAVRSGKASYTDVLQWAAPYEQQDYQLKTRDSIFKDQNNTRADKQRIAGDNVDYAAGVVVGRAVDQITHQMNLNNTDDLNKLVSLEKAGGIPGPVWQQYGQQIASIRAQLATRMTADSDAHGYTQSLGGKGELNKRINEALKPLDVLLDRVYNHDFGGIYDAKVQLTTQNDETKKGILNDPKIGPYFQQVQAIKDLGGEQNLQQFNLNSIKGDFNSDYTGYFSRVKKEFASQYNMKTAGIPYTFNDVLDNLKRNKVSDGKLNSAIMNEVTKIYDPSVSEPIKMNYAMAAFSPGNRGMISRLQADGYDAKGRPISGQNAVFQKWTSPQMTHEMFRLGKQNPEVWNQYTNWAKETLTNELLPQDIQDLGKHEQPYSNVGWDTKNHRLVYSFNPGANSLNTPSIGDKQIQSTVNRINSNLGNYINIAKETGEDPDAFILKSIASAAGPEVLRNVTGIPYKILRDIGLSRMQFLGNGR